MGGEKLKSMSIQRTEAMIVAHGLSLGGFGLRTRKLRRGGRRGATSLVEAPLAGIVVSE